MNPLQMNTLSPLCSAIVMDAEGDGYLILFFHQHIRSYENPLKNGIKPIRTICLQLIEHQGDNAVKAEENYTIQDTLNRLTVEDIDSGTSLTTFTYDDVGNRITMTKDGVTTDYVYNFNDQLISETTGSDVVSYTYDNNGNTETRTDISGTATYVYNARDRLEAVTLPDTTTISYQYDARNNRISKDVNGTVTNYLIDSNRRYPQVLAEYDSLDTLLADYTFGDDLLKQTRAGVDSYYGYDGLGSTRILADSAGVVTDNYDYSAYGEMINSTGTTANDYLYTGEYYDSNTGQYYLRARNYNPANGRFSTVDPFEGLMTNPMTLHRYLYTTDNPVMYTDPSGEFTIGGMMASIGVMSILNNIAMPNYAWAKDAATIMINPTGLGMRGCDPKFGCGGFKTSRDKGKRQHEGIDILSIPGQTIKAPFSGTVVPSASGAKNNIVIVGDGQYSSYMSVIEYVYDQSFGRKNQGDVLAKAENISNSDKYPKYKGIPNHIHLELYKNKKLVDPTSYFFGQ